MPKYPYENRLLSRLYDDQNPDLQLTAAKKAGCRKIFTDKATGAHVEGPELAKCPRLSRPGMYHGLKLDRLAACRMILSACSMI